MTKASGKSHARRPVNYWSKFNEWWRQVLEESGRRPDAAAINRWYEEYAHEIWSPNDMPTMVETRIHAKCLRSVDEVRNYFRVYRAQRRADAVARMDTTGGDDHGEETDSDAAGTGRGASRKAGAGSKLGSASSANLQQRGGVSKMSGSSAARPGRPSSQANTHTVPYQGSNSYNNSGVATTGVAISESAGVAPWWVSGQAVHAQAAAGAVPHRQQTSGISGPAAGASAVITGYPHASAAADHLRYRAISHTQPASPAQADHSAVNGNEGQPDIGIGDLPYGGPCSSVSTASLGNMFDLHDENDHDPTKGEVAFKGHIAAMHMAASGSQSQPPGCGGTAGCAHGLHQQHFFSQPVPQHGLTLHQQPQSSPLGPDDLSSIFDDCMGDVVLHAELTLLPSQAKHSQQDQQRQVQLPSHQPPCKDTQARVHGCVETSVWQPNPGPAARPQTFQDAPAGMATAHHLAAQSYTQQPQSQQPQYMPFFSGWQQVPTASGSNGQKPHGAASGTVPGAHHDQVQTATASAVAWAGDEVNAVEATPATPMEGIVTAAPSSNGSKNDASWLPPGELAQRGSPPTDGSTGASSDITQSDVRDQQPRGQAHGQGSQGAGLSPDAASSASQVCGPEQRMSEPIEQPQPYLSNARLVEATGQGIRDVPLGGRASAPQPQQRSIAQAWPSATVPSDLSAPSSNAGPEQQFRLVQTQSLDSIPIALCAAQPSSYMVNNPQQQPGQQVQQQGFHHQPQHGLQQHQQQRPEPARLASQSTLQHVPSAPLPPLPPLAPRSQCDRQPYLRSPGLGSATGLGPTITSNACVTIAAGAVGGVSTVVNLQVAPAWGNLHPQPPLVLNQHPNPPLPVYGRSQSFTSGFTTATASAISAQLQQPISKLPAQAPPPLPPGFLHSTVTSTAAAASEAMVNSGATTQPPPYQRTSSWPNAIPFVPNLVQPSQHLQHSGSVPLGVLDSAQTLCVPPLRTTTASRSCGGAPLDASGAAPATRSPPSFRRHSQPGDVSQSYMAMLMQQFPDEPQQHATSELGMAASCPVADLLACWQGGDAATGPTPGDLVPTVHTKQELDERAGAAQPQGLAAGGTGVSAQTAPDAGQGANGINCSLDARTAGEAAATSAAAAPAPAEPAPVPMPRPALTRTLSAPAGDGATPRSAVAGAAIGAFNGAIHLLPSVQLGLTPRQQQQQQQPLSGSGFGTPGLGLGFGSPPGCWGDRALAELEGDSMWLSSMLSGDMTPTFF